MQNLTGLSVVLLILANAVFGLFLHEEHNSLSSWVLAVIFIMFQCGCLTVGWRPFRNFMLLGFKSDIGYSLMALAGASLAVVIVAWIQITAYFMMMLSALLLLRIQLYTNRTGSVLAFLILMLVSFAGLGLSWLPTVLAIDL